MSRCKSHEPPLIQPVGQTQGPSHAGRMIGQNGLNAHLGSQSSRSGSLTAHPPATASRSCVPPLRAETFHHGKRPPPFIRDARCSPMLSAMITRPRRPPCRQRVGYRRKSLRPRRQCHSGQVHIFSAECRIRFHTTTRQHLPEHVAGDDSPRRRHLLSQSLPRAWSSRCQSRITTRPSITLVFPDWLGMPTGLASRPSGDGPGSKRLPIWLM